MKKDTQSAVQERLKIREFTALNNKTVEVIDRILQDKNLPQEAVTDLKLLLLKTAEINTRDKKKQDRKDQRIKREKEWESFKHVVYVPQRELQTEEGIKEDHERFAALSVVEKERFKIFFSFPLGYLRSPVEDSVWGEEYSFHNPFYKLLKKAGIKTIGILAACNDAELRNLGSVGKRSINDVHFLFKERGLDFNSLTQTFIDLCIGFDAKNTEEKPLELSVLTVGHLLLPPYMSEKKMSSYLKKNFGPQYPLEKFLKTRYDHLRSLDEYFGSQVEDFLFSVLNHWVPNWDLYPIAQGMMSHIKDSHLKHPPFRYY